MKTIALWRIERKRMRSRLCERKTGIRTHQMLRIMIQLPGLHIHHRQRTLTEIQRRHHRILDALRILLRRLQTVDHQLHKMRLVTVQRRQLAELAQLTVHSHLSVSTLTHLLQQLLVMTLSAPHKRRQQITLATRIVLHNQRHDLLIRITDHRLACLRRISSRGTRIKKSQEIVDFSDCSHSRTRVVSRRLLLNGNNRTEACNRLNLRLFQYAHKMLRIGRKRVHITPLTLCVYRIECQRRLAAAAQSRHHDKLAARNCQRSPLQVVRPRPDNLYIIILLLHLNPRKVR